ncbi:MAG: phosphomannomutase [Oligoflexia bacterium]|nr:phosphomannomutase [Oligoflexia bacterium]
MAIAFGTSGIRGPEIELTDALCERYARAFLRHFRSKTPSLCRLQCVIAGDLRRSTPRITEALARGIRAEGFEVLDGGLIPTPALALECLKRDLPGIMVTGSHIPADRNGIKFYFPWGEILKEDEAPILANERALQTEAPAGGGAIERVKIAAGPNFVRRYVQFFGSRALEGKTILFYEHSSAARELFPEILEGLGARVIRFGRSEEFIPVDTEAVESLRALGAEVVRHAAFALLSTDGDGDRPLVMDERGLIIRGDLLGIIAARELRSDSVATPLSTSTALELSGFVPEVRRTKIGSPYVVAAMDEALAAGRRLVVGFEPNGGFLLGSDLAGSDQGLSKLPTRDCVLPALLVLVSAAKRGLAVSQVIAELPPRFVASELIRDFAVERSRALLERLRQGGTEYFTAEWGSELGACTGINELDGVRASFVGGAIVHLRPSGNAPEFRIYAEAATEAEAAALGERVKGWVGRLDFGKHFQNR